MKIIDVYTKIADSLKEDNPLKNICNKDTTEIFNAKYDKYSTRGHHFVDYKFISPELNRRTMYPLNTICSNTIRFRKKSNALRFIRLVNAEGDYVEEKLKDVIYCSKSNKHYWDEAGIIRMFEKVLDTNITYENAKYKYPKIVKVF